MVILDHEGALGDPVQVAVAALAGGADIIQVREKERSEAEVATLSKLCWTQLVIRTGFRSMDFRPLLSDLGPDYTYRRR